MALLNAVSFLSMQRDDDYLQQLVKIQFYLQKALECAHVESLEAEIKYLMSAVKAVYQDYQAIFKLAELSGAVQMHTIKK